MSYTFRARPWIDDPVDDVLSPGEHWLVPRGGVAEPDHEDAVPTGRPVQDLAWLEERERIMAALARIDPSVFGDLERPHFNTGVVSGSMHYAHRAYRHYVPMSARQREMDRLAKPRGIYGLVRNEMARAGLLGAVRGSGSGRYWH